MNDQIRELYLQAHSTRHYDGDPSLEGNPPTVYWQGEVSAQRFAELIVRECIDKIETYRIPVGNSAAGEMACEWTYDALKEIRDEIREHFGVEE